MPSIRKEGDKKEVIWNWGSHVDQMIREAQARGDFDNLPGMGKPLNLDDDVYAGEMASAYRIAKNANAAPLWVQLDKEIGEDRTALDAMLERNARHLTEMKGTADAREAARLQARALYLEKAAELHKKIAEFNMLRPRQLSWLEKAGLLPPVAARRYDERIPPFEAAQNGPIGV
jgi:hypothetical protein